MNIVPQSDSPIQSYQLTPESQGICPPYHHNASKTPQDGASTSYSTEAALVCSTSPPELGWQDPHLTRRGLYHCPECSNLVLPKSTLQGILGRLVHVFKTLSLKVNYENSPIRAMCESLEQVSFCVSLLEQRDNQQQVLLEIQRQQGDGISFNQYAHQIMAAVQNEGAPPSPSCHPYQSCLSTLRRADALMLAQQNNSIAQSLEMAHDLLYSDRYDAQRLGLETLCNLTDPNKTGLSTAEATAAAVLLGVGPTSVCPRVQHRILQWVSGNDDSCIDSELTLNAVATATQVLSYKKDEQLMSQFVESCSHCGGCDLMSILLSKVQGASQHPHEAYYAVKILAAICDVVPRLLPTQAVAVVGQAQQVGNSSHEALEQASKGLLIALHK